MAASFIILLSGLLALTWIPILLRFVRSWRARRNPVSLAICGIILLSIYSNVLTIAVYALDGEPVWAAIATHAFNALICLNFYLAFEWTKKRFPDARN